MPAQSLSSPSIAFGCDSSRRIPISPDDVADPEAGSQPGAIEAALSFGERCIEQELNNHLLKQVDLTYG